MADILNSAENYNENNSQDAPTQAISFQQWFDNQFKGTAWEGKNVESFNNLFFKPRYNQLRDQYETYLSNLLMNNEYKATQSARAYDTYMSNTQYQRTIKDLESAGLNPYLLVNSGSISTGGTIHSAKADYKNGKRENRNNSENGMNLIVLGLLNLISRGVASAMLSKPATQMDSRRSYNWNFYSKK